MVETTSGIRFAEIISETVRLVRTHPSPILVYSLIMALISTLAAIATDNEYINGLASSVVSLFTSFFIVKILLHKEGYLAGKGRIWRIGSYAIANIIALTGILIGSVFLIFPGFYLAARWSIFQVLVVSEGYGPVEALRESWFGTLESQWQIMLANLVFLITYVIAMIALIVAAIALFGENFLGDEGGPLTWDFATNAANFIADFLTELVGAIGTVMGVAIAIVLRPSAASLNSVFE